MHELSIATSIFEAVSAEAAKRPGAKFAKVGVRVGELAALDADSLSFGWECLTNETDFEGLKLEIQTVPWRNQCPACGEEFLVRDYQTQCPKCQELVTRCIGGEELDIAYIELDEELEQK